MELSKEQLLQLAPQNAKLNEWLQTQGETIQATDLLEMMKQLQRSMTGT